jgi:protease II
LTFSDWRSASAYTDAENGERRECAKWVAKLRLNKTDSNMLLFKCEMGAGHFSQSGRFDILKEASLDMAFILKCVDKHV